MSRRSHGRYCRYWGLLFAALFAATSAPAADQAPDTALDLARAHAAFEAGDYAAAITALDAAMRADPHPHLLYDRALCHERLGQFEAATADYQSFLRADPDPFAAVAVEERLRLLAARERLRLSAPALVLASPPAVVKPRGARPWLWPGLTAGGAALIWTVHLGLYEHLNGQIAGVRSPCPEPSSCGVPRSQWDQIHRGVTADDVVMGAGAAMAAAAVISWGLLWDSKRRAGHVFILPTPGGATAGGTF